MRYMKFNMNKLMIKEHWRNTQRCKGKFEYCSELC